MAWSMNSHLLSSHLINRLIQSASRSPPGLGILQVTCLMHFSHFGTPFGVNFATLGSLLEHFGFAFAPLGSFLEHFGYTFCVKKRIGAPKVPQERPKAPTPVSPSHFGSHFGGYFRWFLWFFPFRTRCKNICVFRCVFCVIFLIFGAGRTSKI